MRGRGRGTQRLDMHSQAARCVCVYRFIFRQCVRVCFIFIPTKNKYSAQTELKQEREQEDEAEEEEEEEEEEGGVHSLSVCQEGMLTVAFKLIPLAILYFSLLKFSICSLASPLPPSLPPSPRP